MTQRWKITLEYDGTPFVGWQRQEKGLSVQGCVEEAIFRFCGERVTIHVSGRTDAGVHAVGQVAHFDLEKDTDERSVREAVNYHLRSHPVSVLQAKAVSPDFHARFSAQHRVYCYRIVTERFGDTVLEQNRVWHVRHALDAGAMNKAARHLLGTHDFTSFRDAECQAKTPVRTIDRLEFMEEKNPLTSGRHLALWAEARSFLHHQIRNIAGTLKLVGEGKWSPDEVRRVLEARDRRQAGPTAPACGLYFMRVDYPDADFVKGLDSLL